jgi:preprotein translocase subunit SecA
MLLTIDENWKEHLREMDQLRQSVQNASYEQKDPLVIYKTEAFNMFKQMVGIMNGKSIAILMRGQIPEAPPQENVSNNEPRPRQRYSEGRGGEPDASRPNAPVGPRPQGPTGPIRNEGPKIGRNDPCPCGSGKKYKNCHGRGLA